MIADRIIVWSLAFALAFFPALASAQSPQVQQLLLGAGKGAPGGAAYQGPGDVVSGALVWGSTARAYNSAYANGTNPLADLKDLATGTVAICTLRVATTGFVDLTGGYCIGSTTPSIACAAAAGGSCIVSKVYDQTGNARDYTQATAASMPGLIFGALNGLPALQCGGSAQLLSPTITQAQPFSTSTVYIRTSGASIGAAVGSGGGAIVQMGASSVANTAILGYGNPASVSSGAVADNAWHAFQGSANGASGASNIDGTDLTSTNYGTNSFGGNAFRLCSDSANFLIGKTIEGGLWPSATTPTQRGNVNVNQHSSSNGYNF